MSWTFRTMNAFSIVALREPSIRIEVDVNHPASFLYIIGYMVNGVLLSRNGIILTNVKSEPIHAFEEGMIRHIFR